jgi:hypothetical protein
VVNGNHVVDAERYIKDATCPDASPKSAFQIVCPVLALTVRVVIVCVVLNVTVIPSTGFAGMVIVPVANVPAGFIINTLYVLKV